MQAVKHADTQEHTPTETEREIEREAQTETHTETRAQTEIQAETQTEEADIANDSLFGKKILPLAVCMPNHHPGALLPKLWLGFAGTVQDVFSAVMRDVAEGAL
jgi:hypothetical protein